MAARRGTARGGRPTSAGTRPRRLRRLGRHGELRDARRPWLDRPGGARDPARAGDPDRRDHGMSVLAIDAGTTGVTALVVTEDGRVAVKGYQEFAQHFPQAGWVEHSPEEIWQATLEATRSALQQYDGPPLRAVGITNQRETVLLWDRETLGSPRRAIVWQDRRTADICRRMRDEGHEERVAELTGSPARPLLLGHQARLDRRARAEHLGAGRGGPLRHRHRRLLPGRADDARHLARHRRLQRVPHLALRPRRGRLERRAVRAVRRPEGRAARGRAVVGRDRDAPTRRRSSGSSCRSPASSATSSPRSSGRPASRSATPSAPTAPARSSSPTPAPRSSAPTPGCSRRRPGAPPTAS